MKKILLLMASCCFIGHGSMAAGLQALPIEASYIIPAEVGGMSSSSLL